LDFFLLRKNPGGYAPFNLSSTTFDYISRDCGVDDKDEPNYAYFDRWSGDGLDENPLSKCVHPTFFKRYESRHQGFTAEALYNMLYSDYTAWIKFRENIAKKYQHEAFKVRQFEGKEKTLGHR
jgi:hypothetical protein